MENDHTADLLGDFSSGDTLPPVEPSIKREQDSVDDFEHLDRESTKRDEFGDSPQHGTARAATQSFLDTEREELFIEPTRVNPAFNQLNDQLADKFTDSESSAGESPLHRPQPRTEAPLVSEIKANAPTPEPALDPTPSLVPTTPPKPEPIVEKKPLEDPLPPKIEPEPVPVPVKPAQEAKPLPAVPASPPKPNALVIEAEVIFCQMGLDAWFDPQRLHPKVESLLYWRDPARSGAALGAGLALLVALACCSVVSVLAYVSLLGLTAAVGFRIYKNVMQAVQKTNEGHPFKFLLDKDISVPADRAQSLAAAATAHLNATANELRRLFLVEDLIDSLKFGVLLWCLTYVGAYFNGITLIILGWIALFTLPKAYEMNKAQVDANLELARAKINEITSKVRAAVPLGRKSESEKDK